ncbi:MAG TPA: lysophospholipid acyltransferase family protein [Chloroflexota bacterium]|jgi:1-acyl-sn-glycerol-3-phosphate acyltransferase
MKQPSDRIPRRVNRIIAPPTAYRRWVQQVIWATAWLLTRLMRTDVAGDRPTAPCIIVSNHLHYLDIPLAGRYAIAFGEHVHGLAKTELFQIPLIGAVLRGIQAVEVHRGSADRRAIEEIISFARQEKVWIFPEGHRSDTGRLQEGKEGTVLVARRAGTPLVPMAIAGTEAGFLALLLHRKTLRIRMGRPFTLPPGLSRSESIAEIMRRIEDLLPAQQQRLR